MHHFKKGGTSRLGLELNKTSPSFFRERESLGGQGSQLKKMLAFDVHKSLSFPFFLEKEKQLLPNAGEKMVICHDTTYSNPSFGESKNTPWKELFFR